MGGPGGSAPRLENFWRFRGGQNAILTKFSRHGRSQPLTQKPNPGREIAINRTRHTLSPRRPRLRCIRLRCPRKPRKLSRRGRSIRSYRLSGTCARYATHPGLPCARNTPPRIPTSPRCTAFNLAMTDQPSIPTLNLARQTAAGLKAELSSARDYSAVVQHTLAAELCAFESSLATGQVIGTAQAAPRDVPAPSTSMQMQSVDPRSLPTHDGSSGGDSRRPCLRANFSDWMITIGPEIFLRAVRGA